MRRPPVLNIPKMLAQGLRSHTNGRGRRGIQLPGSGIPLPGKSIPRVRANQARTSCEKKFQNETCILRADSYTYFLRRTFPGGAVVAQLTVNQRVAGSNPARGASEFAGHMVFAMWPALLCAQRTAGHGIPLAPKGGCPQGHPPQRRAKDACAWLASIRREANAGHASQGRSAESRKSGCDAAKAGVSRLGDLGSRLSALIWTESQAVQDI